MIKSLFCLLIFTSTSFAEEPMIDLDRVAPVVKKRLLQFGADQFTSPDQFELSCSKSFNPKGYTYNHMAFEIDLNIEKVWKAYLYSSPKKAWGGKTIHFDFAYSKPHQAVYYHDDLYIPKIHVGMGFFIVLDIHHLTKLAASLEVSKIDFENKIFEYTYLAKNTSHGKQTMHFIDLGNNKTRIEHNTYFKSDSKLRDKLYPQIHEALLEEFHQNIMNQINAKALRVE